jgi:hypothetical protein
MLKKHLEPELRPDASPTEIMKQIVLTLESTQKTHQFTEHELVEEAHHYGLDHDEAEWAVRELIDENWLQEVEGTEEEMVERVVWSRFSPNLEDIPEY